MEPLSEFLSRTNIIATEALAGESLSVRDLAKRAGCSPAKITQFVKLFARNGLVRLESEKNRKIVSLETGSPLARGIVSLIFIRKILGSKAFLALKKGAISSGVYGSVAEGTVDGKSDIDLWALVEKKISIAEAGEIRAEFGRELGRETSIRFLTAEDVKNLKKNDSIFYNELEYKSVILSGDGLGQ